MSYRFLTVITNGSDEHTRLVPIKVPNDSRENKLVIIYRFHLLSLHRAWANDVKWLAVLVQHA